MLLVAVTLTIVPERAEAFRDRIRQQAADSLGEPGCRRFDVWCDTDDCCRVFLFEVYDDRAAFDAHLESRHFRDFDAAAGPWVQERKVELWTLSAG